MLYKYGHKLYHGLIISLGEAHFFSNHLAKSVQGISTPRQNISETQMMMGKYSAVETTKLIV
jgi:hypothetical protein